MIDARRIEQNLRFAEQQEIIGGEETFAAELRTVFSGDYLEKGVSIEVGDDKDALETVLNLLGVGTRLEDESELGVYQSYTVATGCTSHVGGAQDSLAKLDLVDALDALQVNNLRAGKNEYPSISYPYLFPHDNVSGSFISIGHYKTVEGVRQVDLTRPGLLVGARYRYLPDFDEEYEGYGADLTYFMEERIKNPSHERSSSRIATLAMYMADNAERLTMPSSSYFIQVGTPYVGGRIMPTLDGVMVTRFYEVQNGHLKLVKDLENLDEI